MFKKLKEKIQFLKWAYANRNVGSKTINAYIKVNNIEPKLVCAEMIVGNGELNQYRHFIRERLVQQFMNSADRHLVMEENDLLNGTTQVSIRCYISPFVEGIK